MKFKALSRNQLKEFSTDLKHIKIIIHDPNTEKPSFIDVETCIEHMFLEFDDVSYESEYDLVFNNDHAKKILNIYNKHKTQIELIVVSCEMGISRSAGVIAALDEIEHEQESLIFYDSTSDPNRLVYKKIIDLINKK